MDIPSTYTNRDVMSKVINPALAELQNYFQNLQCTVKYEHKRGKPVSGYVFTFKPEQPPKIASTDTKSRTTEQPSSSSLKPKKNYNQDKPKNQFHQFMQREITPEELEELEQKLLEH